MSAKERERLKVLHEGRKRHITQKQAGVELGLSARWIRTLRKRVRREGDTACGTDCAGDLRTGRRQRG
jgi:Homeodomain-like domain